MYCYFAVIWLVNFAGIGGPGSSSCTVKNAENDKTKRIRVDGATYIKANQFNQFNSSVNWFAIFLTLFYSSFILLVLFLSTK